MEFLSMQPNIWFNTDFRANDSFQSAPNWKRILGELKYSNRAGACEPIPGLGEAFFL